MGCRCAMFNNTISLRCAIIVGATRLFFPNRCGRDVMHQHVRVARRPASPTWSDAEQVSTWPARHATPETKSFGCDGLVVCVGCVRSTAEEAVFAEGRGIM